MEIIQMNHFSILADLVDKEITESAVTELEC